MKERASNIADACMSTEGLSPVSDLHLDAIYNIPQNIVPAGLLYS
jgi:hypothetical protein